MSMIFPNITTKASHLQLFQLMLLNRQVCQSEVMCCGFSELKSTELLVNSQDVMVELSGEQQVLQGAHILLDDHMMLWVTMKIEGN